MQAAPSRCRPHLVLGQLDLAALQVEAQQRWALQLLCGAGQPLQQLLQLVLELPQAQQSCLQLVLSRQGWNWAHVWWEQWQPQRRAQRSHGPTHRRVLCTQCLPAWPHAPTWHHAPTRHYTPTWHPMNLHRPHVPTRHPMHPHSAHMAPHAPTLPQLSPRAGARYSRQSGATTTSQSPQAPVPMTAAPTQPCPMPGIAPAPAKPPPYLAADDLLFQVVPPLAEIAERGRGVPLPRGPQTGLVPQALHIHLALVELPLELLRGSGEWVTPSPTHRQGSAVPPGMARHGTAWHGTADPGLV